VIGKRVSESPSIYPDDRESRHFDPLVFANEPAPIEAHHEPYVGPDAHELVARSTDDELTAFLTRILREIRTKRHDMVTHHNADDLLDTLGFAEHAPRDDEDAPNTGHGGKTPPSDTESRPEGPSPHGEF
jgi:hypothetical protein